MVNVERIHKDLTRITSDKVDPGGVDRRSMWKGSTKTFQGLPLTMLILGEVVNQWLTWEGSAKTLQGLPLTMLILGWGRLTVNLGRICKDFARIASDNVNPWGGVQSTVNLGGISEEFARITSDNVDPGGPIKSQLGKDPQRLCKDYL